MKENIVLKIINRMLNIPLEGVLLHLKEDTSTLRVISKRDTNILCSISEHKGYPGLPDVLINSTLLNQLGMKRKRMEELYANAERHGKCGQSSISATIHSKY